MTPQQARSSILAQQCGRRWEASRTRDRAPHASTMTEHTNTRKHRQTTKQQQQQQQQQQRQRKTDMQHSSTAHKPPSFQRPTQLLQSKSRVASAQTMATCADQPGALLFCFLYTPSKVHRRKGVVFFSCLCKSTYRSSTICPVMD